MHLYLHIPFCKQACHYCDFHFSTNTERKTDIVKAICNEIELQKFYLKEKELRTIYFGGGTPSLLSDSELNLIFNTITKHFTVQKGAEITLEANPDDISISKLEAWKNAGINRLSIGIQSFNEAHLRFLNRAHNADHAKQCISQARNVGFENLTIDLIYAIPADSNEIWKSDLQKAFAFEIPHISSYCLTIEEKTVFGHQVKHKIMEPIDDDFASGQFEILLEFMSDNNFEQYEISNFAKQQKYAKHNTSYWQGDEYLGVGPSAHSFNGDARQWNVSSNGKYLKSIKDGQIPFELEILSNKDKMNEALLTGLRTMWGVDLRKVSHLVDLNSLAFRKELNSFQEAGLLLYQNQTLILTDAGKLKADYIASELFF